MANAARVHAVENGEDLSEYTMIAFGGAAPLHAGRLCEKLGVDRLLVPTGAGVGSAIGFLRAPFSFEANRSVYMRLSDFDAATIKTLLADLQHRGHRLRAHLRCDSPHPDRIQGLHALYRAGLGNSDRSDAGRPQQTGCRDFPGAVRGGLHQSCSAAWSRAWISKSPSGRSMPRRRPQKPVAIRMAEAARRALRHGHGTRAMFDPALGHIQSRPRSCNATPADRATRCRPRRDHRG